jgi:hypothetical protein
MNQKIKINEMMDNFPIKHLDLLNKICKEINMKIKDKREIMYSDIINLIIRKGYKGVIFNKLMIWCNYNIRSGRLILSI